MNNKLKPCPFCGSNDIKLTSYYLYDGYQGESPTWVATCNNCHINVANFNKEKVIEVWNNRSDNN